MNRQQFDTLDLPDNPGIYFFKKGKDILYVGKATSLRDRVRSYFSRDLITTRGPLLVKMVEEAETITWTETASVLEALILEAFTIKKHLPAYNTKEKDNKSYNFVVITDEKYPRVLVERGRSLLNDPKLSNSEIKLRSVFGPFPHGTQLRDAVKIVRKIFPFRDKCIPNSGKACFNRQIGLCPGVCTGEVSRLEYARIVRNIELFFSGKKDQIQKNLEKEMKGYAKAREFEKAEIIKRRVFALDHIRDVSLIRNDVFDSGDIPQSGYRIEAYDIAHISGKDTVGVMVALEDGELSKNEYRKFKIKGVGGEVTVDDTKNLKELLTRRLGHAEWRLPNLIVLDGGIAQRNTAEEVLKARGFSIEIASVVKDERHTAKEIVGNSSTIQKHGKEILLINGESHRFAQAYHTNLRRRPYRIDKKKG